MTAGSEARGAEMIPMLQVDSLEKQFTLHLRGGLSLPVLHGVNLTVHAGEWAGPSEVRDALRDLGAVRIGHGVRAIEDLALVDELAERGIVLECCPGSNVALGIYPSFRKHPIGQLYHRGVKVTVSTDDPPFFHTSMKREYDMLHQAFDWDDGVFATLNRTALDAAFCDADTKDKIAKRLEAAHV